MICLILAEERCSVQGVVIGFKSNGDDGRFGVERRRGAKALVTSSSRGSRRGVGEQLRCSDDLLDTGVGLCWIRIVLISFSSLSIAPRPDGAGDGVFLRLLRDLVLLIVVLDATEKAET